MGWKDDVAKQVRDNKWEFMVAVSTSGGAGLVRRKRIAVEIPGLRPLAMHLVKLIGSVNASPFCGAEPGCMTIEGFETNAGLVTVFFDFGEEPYENPVDSKGKHLCPPIDFDASFAKLSRRPDWPRCSRPG